MSTVSFHSYQIKGKGVGTSDVVPTINLAIPSSLDLPFGVYAGRVHLQYKNDTPRRRASKHLSSRAKSRDPSIPAESAGGRDDGYAVALHFGPRPTDQDPSPSLELHVLDAQKFDTDYNAEEIDVEIVQFIREIRRFDNFAQLRDQIQKDIGQIRKVLQIGVVTTERRRIPSQ